MTTSDDADVAALTARVEAGLGQVRERIVNALSASRRKPGAVRLIAVSKFQPAEAMRVAYALGQRDFGENYVQELEEKAASLADLSGLKLHLIGHLQRNKVKKVASLASSVQSVDSVELARELAKRVAAAVDERRARFGQSGERLDVLIQVSIAGEAQKSGVAPELLRAVVDAVEVEPALRLRGLMCVPPLDAAPEAARVHFERLAALREAHGGSARLPELSMGMTQDLEQAIAAGATLVRVGTAIFGDRKAAESPA